MLSNAFDFCLIMLNSDITSHSSTFIIMNNIVHIKEKWFYMNKKSMNYYMLLKEDELNRIYKSKNFIENVML